jgi:hypothetical protein
LPQPSELAFVEAWEGGAAVRGLRKPFPDRAADQWRRLIHWRSSC